MGGDRPECRLEPGLLERRPDSIGVLHDGPPERIEAGLLGHPHAAADVHLAGLEVEVAAVPVGGAIGLDQAAVGRALEPREARPEVRLVRRLVLREARVAVDPEDRALGIGEERDVAGRQALRQRGDQRLDRFLEQPLVVGLARVEPVALVVRREVGQEVDGLGPEPAERGRGDGHGTTPDWFGETNSTPRRSPPDHRPCGSPILPLVTGTIPRQPATRLRFNRRLFRWHDSAAAPSPSGEAATPWQVLVAEVMSQQTGIERVGPAWRRFIERWPTPADLAAAGTHELLAAWAGLGYNRRALALREAARAIVADHGGRVPATVEALERLPGVGPYTARAVAAAAFGVPVAPLDVNTRRVVSRVLGVSSSWPGVAGGGRRPRLARPARSLARCRDGPRDRDVHPTRTELRPLPARGDLRVPRRRRAPSRRRAAARRSRPPLAGFAGASSPPSRRRRQGHGCRCPNASASTMPTPSTRRRAVSSAMGSSTCATGAARVREWVHAGPRSG